jgi:pimeloyl-ACP methyl ester carboxylesterase
MKNYTATTTPTQFIQANGIRYAYRRFGKQGGVPLVFNQHFTGTLDHWDPAVLDGIAAEREVITFNSAGIASSSGEVPRTIEGMAASAEALIDQLGLREVDVLGFSLGGTVAQQITLDRPELVRRLILVGTGPRGGEGMEGLTPGAQAIFGASYNPPENLWLSVHFTQSDRSQAAGRAFLQRFLSRTDRDVPVADTVAGAQIEALGHWGKSRPDPYGYLQDIHQPTLVVNGTHDVIIYTRNSLHLAQNLPNAKLLLYPDANHGSQYQYVDEFVSEVNTFLSK